MLTYFNNVLLGEAEPFWPHIVLLSLSVLAGIAVGAGIIFESPEYASATHRVAKWLVIIGVAVESVCTVSLFAFDEGVSSAQQSEISRQNVEIVSLRKQSIPRSIAVSAFAEKLEGAPPARIKIWYVVACGDCESLTFWLSEALRKANWTVDPVIPIAPENRDWVQAVRSLHAQSTGITVVIDSPDKITADPKTSLGALNWALEQALGFGFLGYDSAVQGAVDVTMEPNVIRLVIAPKA